EGGAEGRSAQDQQHRAEGGSPGAGERIVTAPEVVISRDADLLAASAAARLLTKLVDAQSARGWASVVLTGGRTGNAVLSHLRDSPARDAVDWSAVDLYWGDER